MSGLVQQSGNPTDAEVLALQRQILRLKFEKSQGDPIELRIKAVEARIAELQSQQETERRRTEAYETSQLLKLKSTPGRRRPELMTSVVKDRGVVCRLCGVPIPAYLWNEHVSWNHPDEKDFRARHKASVEYNEWKERQRDSRLKDREQIEVKQEHEASRERLIKAGFTPA